MIDINTEFLAQIKRIADALEKIAGGAGDPDAAPDLRAPIEDFLAFDWEAIGATVVSTDREGPSTVEYQGKLWTRRSGNNPDFGAAIWFSRGIGKDEKGQNRYACLVKFQKVRQAKALPENAAELAAKGAPAPTPAEKKTGLPPLQQSAGKPATEKAHSDILVEMATSTRFNLTKEAALWLFEHTNNDLSLSTKLLPIMAEGKGAGMTGKEITALMVKGGLDPEVCLRLVRAATAIPF